METTVKVGLVLNLSPEGGEGMAATSLVSTTGGVAMHRLAAAGCLARMGATAAALGAAACGAELPALFTPNAVRAGAAVGVLARDLVTLLFGLGAKFSASALPTAIFVIYP